MTEPNQSQPSGTGSSFWRQARSFVFIIVVFLAFRSAVADWNDVPSGSMLPTILEGDRIFVNKLAYDLKLPFTTTHLFTWDNPSRGDIVVFFSPADGERLVKRVIALPGDQIELRDNRLFINGVSSQYTAINPNQVTQLPANDRIHWTFAMENEPTSSHPHEVMGIPYIQARRDFGPTTIPPDHYFMMGDNRDNSKDSRYFGFVDRSRIVGRAVGVVASLDINHHWVPRWGRFFKPLS
jgi:signal peptidase I